jgi:hypothetical protein
MTDKAQHAPQEYLGNGNHKWERAVGDTFRLRVPGGWLYRAEFNERAIGLAFVPDHGFKRVVDIQTSV